MRSVFYSGAILLSSVFSTAASLAADLPLFADKPTTSLATQDEQAPTTPPVPETQCVETDQIAAYKVESDDIVRLFLKSNEQLILRLKRHCPQLYFHRYISYTPVDGKICAGSDEIKTRAGLACRIDSITPVAAAKEQTSERKTLSQGKR